nr:Peptidase M12A domain containing protein [Haemonchus contortus]
MARYDRDQFITLNLRNIKCNTDYQETLGSHFMSFIDLSMINELYGCKKNCVGKRSANCKMGGFPNPRDCSKCVCPGGYAGFQCTERPDEGCGSKIDATEEWKTLTDVLGDYSVRQPLEDFKKCNYWIEVR